MICQILQELEFSNGCALMSNNASIWEDIDASQSAEVVQIPLPFRTPKNLPATSYSGSTHKFATSPLSVTLLNDESSDSFCDDFHTYDKFLNLPSSDNPIVDMCFDIMAVDYEDMGSRDETDCESWFDCDKEWLDDQDHAIKPTLPLTPLTESCSKDDVKVVGGVSGVVKASKMKQDVGTMTGSWFENMIEGTAHLSCSSKDVFQEDIEVLRNWFEDVDVQPMSVQDPVTINFDIDVFGKADSENWFDVVERRYIEEMGMNVEVCAI